MKNFILKKRNIKFHFIATFLTCGFWAILYFYFKYLQKGSSYTISNYDGSFGENNYSFEELFGMNRENYEKAKILMQQYKQVTTLHYEYTEKIGIAYTIANNLSMLNSPEMQHVIDLCLKDIQLAPTFSEYCKKMAKLYNDKNEYITNYPSFQRLAIIYEKQKEYQKAIEICKLAIQLGFYKDNTTGQMPGRLARLVKKNNQSNLKLN